MTVGPGTLLGERYELTALLGRGGMADVFSARDRVLHRDVAVKVLRESPDTEADRVRFAAEARVLAGLAHPGLVLLLDAESGGAHPYLVLELVVGRTWARELAGGRAEPLAVARIGVQVAAALAHAHAAGVVHRDVKPANVLVDAAGRAKLADFGIARLVDEHVRHTRTGFTVGTAAYLAPEQVRGEPATAAVDVYALGLVLLEALTGERAFPGTSTESAFARLQRNPTVPVSLPRGWPRLLAAMTATDPAERLSAAAVADALAALADPDGVEVAPALGDDPTEAVRLAPAARRPFAPPALLAAAGALALLLVVAGLVGGAGGVDDSAAAGEAPSSGTGSTGPAAPRSSAADPTPAVVRAATTSEPSARARPTQPKPSRSAKPPRHLAPPRHAHHAGPPKHAKPKGGPQKPKGGPKKPKGGPQKSKKPKKPKGRP